MGNCPQIIWCADGNASHSRIAISCGWAYGVRLPAKGMLTDVPLAMADQDWKKPDRGRYMALLERHRPALATVLDWEHPNQYGEVMSWAEEAAGCVAEAVIVIPKVPGTVLDIPQSIGGTEVRLGYSVPTSYGGSPLFLSEFSGRTVHLLGGTPQRQHEIWSYLRGIADVRSLDGNVAKKMATSRCLYWQRLKSRTGHWVALDGFVGNGPEECVRRTCLNVMDAWQNHWSRA